MSSASLGKLETLPNPSVIGLELELPDRLLALILTRQDERVCAFLNSCPHTGVRLDWRPQDFLDVSTEFLQCAMHGALFEQDSGRCVAGPCVGRHLFSVELEIDAAGNIRALDLESLPESALARR